mmetsp:Transcript_8063/g.19277  ORF Transcript_8063/g.19277 Transcript_8063/m.19277 type:complete len:245 (+) Transcript_8063:91-825(+)
MATNESEISSEIYSSFGVLSSELVSEILALACNSEVLQLCTSHFAKVNSQFQSSCKGALRRCQRLQYVEHTFLLMLAKRGGARKFHKVFKSLMSNTGNLCTVDISGSCSISDEDVLILVVGSSLFGPTTDTSRLFRVVLHENVPVVGPKPESATPSPLPLSKVISQTPRGRLLLLETDGLCGICPSLEELSLKGCDSATPGVAKLLRSVRPFALSLHPASPSSPPLLNQCGAASPEEADARRCG